MEINKKLKHWLKQPGNDKLKLAHLLGYKSSETIRLWVEGRKIPSFQEARVLAILNEEITFEEKVFQKLQAWVNFDPSNTKTRLAKLMGYSSSSPITKWFKRGWVPEHAAERVNKIITRESKC